MPLKQMAYFQEAIIHSGLSDIPSSGQRFTWSNNRRGATFTKERINKAIANLVGMNLFPGSTRLVLSPIKSDHPPLIICLEKYQVPTSKRPYIFGYGLPLNVFYS